MGYRDWGDPLSMPTLKMVTPWHEVQPTLHRVTSRLKFVPDLGVVSRVVSLSQLWGGSEQGQCLRSRPGRVWVGSSTVMEHVTCQIL